MNNRQILLTAILSTFFTLSVIAGSMLFSSQAVAAPPGQVTATPTLQVTPTAAYLSVSSLAFMPVDQSTFYHKDVRRQMLTLTNQPISIAADSNIFIAPLTLPDSGVLTGMTVFGEDFDNQGGVQMRLKRCDHSQARCISLAETSSANNYAAGQFETLKVAIPSGMVNNYFYSYFLELELTTINGGLRSVRLELAGDTTSPPPVGSVKKWTLAGTVTNFLLPNQGLTETRICTGDLSHLNNPTHYPQLVVDGQVIPLSASMCVTVLGYNMQLRRELNAGSSSGTYQFLR